MITFLTVHSPTVALAAAMLGATAAGSAFASVPVRRTSDHVQTGGRDVRVDVYQGAVDGPVVLLLHGVGGLLGDGALMRRTARTLAESGFKACVVHYFNATGTLFSTAHGAGQHAPIWKRAIEDVVQHYGAGDRAVGIFGYSLGGFLGVGISRDLPEVGALVVFAGGVMAEHENEAVKRLAPMLILHGGKDDKVAPDRAEALVRLADRAGGSAECVLYPGEGHAFAASAERDALRRSVVFFSQRLGTGETR